jgi:hypothetical protein
MEGGMHGVKLTQVFWSVLGFELWATSLLAGALLLGS